MITHDGNMVEIILRAVSEKTLNIFNHNQKEINSK